MQREYLEDEYWAKNGKKLIKIFIFYKGEPNEIKPMITPSLSNKDEVRNTWIHVFLEKDMIVKKNLKCNESIIMILIILLIIKNNYSNNE